MNLYLIHQSTNGGYDTYDSAVVCAETKLKARKINPSGCAKKDWYKSEDPYDNYTWSDLKDVKADLIGKAKEGMKEGVVCASFNAG